MPTRGERIFVDVRALDAIEREPKLIQRLLHRSAHGHLLWFAHCITFDRQRSNFHMFFVDAHMQSPVANIFRLAVKTIMLGEPIDDASHALVGGSFETESLTSIQLQPTTLEHQQFAPIEKRLGLWSRLNPIELFFAPATGFGESNEKLLMAIGSGDLPCPLLDDVLDPHLFQLGIVRTARQHRRDRFWKRFGEKQIKLSDKTLERITIKLAIFDHGDN